MFLGCDLAPLSSHAQQRAFQVVKSTCELPLDVLEPGMVQLKGHRQD